MGKNINTRPTQTKVKHQILEAYLKAWMGIIFWGVNKPPARIRHAPHFIYVDAFAYKGKYSEGDIDSASKEPVYGSPIIGIQKLDKFAEYASAQGMPVTTNAILLEKDRKIYRALLETLHEVGVGHRIRETTDFHTLRNREIAVANVDSTIMARRLTSYTTKDRYTYSFYLLDPFGGSGIPYDFVQEIVSGPRHDVMINFVYLRFLRDMGLIIKSKNQSSFAEQRRDTWKRVFGKRVWNAILSGYGINTNTDSGKAKDEAIQLMVDRYKEALENMDPEIAVKMITLQFPDKDRAMLRLFLTTHDPTGALTLNKVLYDAKLLEREIRQRVRLAKRLRTGQLILPGLEQELQQSAFQKMPRPDIEEIESEVVKLFAGETTKLRSVYRALVDTDFFPEEVKKAIRSLREKGCADYDGNKLINETVITFRKK